jgi:hypothetical protein
MLQRSLNELEKLIAKMIGDPRASRHIYPIILLNCIETYLQTGKQSFTLAEMRKGYNQTIQRLVGDLGHSLGIGGRFLDTYPDRLVTRSRLLQRHPSERLWSLMPDVAQHSENLAKYIQIKLQEVLTRKAGALVRLQKALTLDQEDKPEVQGVLAGMRPSAEMLDHIENSIDDSSVRKILTDPTSSSFRSFFEHGFEDGSKGLVHSGHGFEVCMFAILKVFLARFGCKLYRDTRTYGSEKGTDISTNFGVVYQVKKECLGNESVFAKLVNELRQNFSAGRIQEGNIFVIVESERKGYGERLRRENGVSCLTKDEIVGLLDDLSPREKLEVLICLLQEFRRELLSRVRMPRRTSP